MTTPLVLFVLISVIWGLTWIPIKVGVSGMPPMLFAATRGLVAGALLLLLRWRTSGSIRVTRAHVGRLLLVAFLSYAATYSLLFWGAARVDSGITAVVCLSLLPTCLLFLGAMLGEEHLGLDKIISTLVGVSGLVVLYSSDVAAAAGNLLSLGLGAVALSTVAYALGVVVSRDLLRNYSPVLVAGWTQLSGAGLLLFVSMATEPRSPGGLSALARPDILASWLFLVVFGSVVAFTCYLRLTHLWSPHRAGLYAFVSPIIAVFAGIWLLEERISRTETVGMTFMLVGAALALRGVRK